MTTWAPSAARRFAIAAPIPREPPVTNATLLFSVCRATSLLSASPGGNRHQRCRVVAGRSSTRGRAVVLGSSCGRDLAPEVSRFTAHGGSAGKHGCTRRHDYV